MKAEFFGLIDLHKIKIEQAKFEYRELEKLFNERPSRPDDVR